MKLRSREIATYNTHTYSPKTDTSINSDIYDTIYMKHRILFYVAVVFSALFLFFIFCIFYSFAFFMNKLMH